MGPYHNRQVAIAVASKKGKKKRTRLLNINYQVINNFNLVNLVFKLNKLIS